MGVAAPSVHGALKRFLHILHNPEESATYEQNRAQILTAVEFRLVNQLANKKKIKAASLNNIAYAVSQINNMIRLEKGQPTSITEHLDTDFEELLDRIAPMKNAGSGSTVDINPPADSPVDVDNVINQAIGLPAPPVDRAAMGQPEDTIQPVQPTKSAKPHKPHTTKPSKSTVKNRNKASCNITDNLNSKVDETKEAGEPIPKSDNQSSQQKEWYD